MTETPILFFEDPIGVTDGYLTMFKRLSRNKALPLSLYKFFPKHKILEYSGQRKAPGYCKDPMVQREILNKLDAVIQHFNPRMLVVSDPAMLFLCTDNPTHDWNWVTIENLRGGVYYYRQLPVLITYPMTAWMRDVRERDIAAANFGYGDEESFEEAKGLYSESGDADSDSDDADETEGSTSSGEEHEFYAPIQTRVQIGKFCLQSDWAKAHRILDSLTPRLAGDVAASIANLLGHMENVGKDSHPTVSGKSQPETAAEIAARIARIRKQVG